MLKEAERTGAFVKAAANTGNGEAEADVDTAQSQRDWVWSSGFAAHALGRYIDYCELLSFPADGLLCS